MLASWRTMNHVDPKDRDSALHVLVREALLERTARLNDTQMIAFVDGWTSALDLLRRTDLLLPGAPASLSEAVATVIEHIRRIQYDVLDDRE